MKPFRVYIASMFADKGRVLERAGELAELGIECTSRWASETIPHNVTMQDCSADYMRETAVYDLQDILKADVVVLTVPEPQLLVDATVSTSSRGGRHFESGFVYGLAVAQMMDGGKPTRELIVLGRQENVFHCLDGLGATSAFPPIKVFGTWEEVKRHLVYRAAFLARTEANNAVH